MVHIQTYLICQAVRSSHRATLYEGLPHQSFEAGLLATELAAKATIRIDVYPFYAQTLPLNETWITSLRQVLGSPASYAAWHGEKLCGGFHPDFAVLWSTPVGELYTLVCLGCEETLTLSSRGRLRADTTESARASLIALLAGQRKNRPLVDSW
ncbi:MAG: hypothetical protein IT368_15585 [Candidatus Hydrogenedentes bacterium]|nr:hypothetical protein [Candidatus Hydrogenedentota bacterium]